jgi:hypothetical protein
MKPGIKIGISLVETLDEKTLEGELFSIVNAENGERGIFKARMFQFT